MNPFEFLAENVWDLTDDVEKAERKKKRDGKTSPRVGEGVKAGMKRRRDEVAIGEAKVVEKVRNRAGAKAKHHKAEAAFWSSSRKRNDAGLESTGELRYYTGGTNARKYGKLNAAHGRRMARRSVRKTSAVDELLEKGMLRSWHGKGMARAKRRGKPGMLTSYHARRLRRR